MSFGFSPALRTSRAQAIVDHLDNAATPGTLALYATSQPATGGDPGGAPLVTITLAKPCGVVVDGVISFAVTTPAQVNPGGIAVWARGRDGDGNFVLDGDVAVSGTSGVAFTLQSTSLNLGAFVFLSAATLTEP